MQAKKILAAVVSFCLIGAANAQTSFTWDGDVDSKWSDPNNWSPSNAGYPGQSAGDSATIPQVTGGNVDPILDVSPANHLSGLTINSSGSLTTGAFTLGVDGTITLNGELVVSSSGVFDIGTGATFTYNSGATLTIDGELRLSTSTSVLEFDANYNTSIGGGMIVGKHDSARINIATDVTLTIASGFEVKGQMEFQGETGGTNPGTFVNDGLVHANVAGGTIHFMNNARLNGSSGEFKASGFDTTVMQFSRAHPKDGLNCVIDADFTVDDCATFDIDADQRTAGNFTCGANGGVVDDESDTFELRYGSCASAGSVADGCGDCS